MKIVISDNVPDGTYFTSSDVEPDIKDGKLIIYDGHGSRRSWGRPEVTSSVVFNTKTFTAIHVGFHHKHKGGQQWYYYLNSERVTWAQLPDLRRKQVLTAMKSKAPSWAKTPGELKVARKNPSKAVLVGYKVVGVHNGEYLSFYDCKTVYRIGKRLTQKVQDGHKGGYYAYTSPELALKLWENSKLTEDFASGVLLKVELAGRTVKYDNNKIAATHITPLEVIQVLNRIPVEA